MIAWVLGANGWRELITCAVAMPGAPPPIARLPGTEAEISVMRVGGGYERPNAGLPIPDDHCKADETDQSAKKRMASSLARERYAILDIF